MTRVRAGVGFGIWIVLWGSLAITDARPSPLLLAGVVALATAVVSAAIDLTEATMPADWTRHRGRREVIRPTDPRAYAVRQQLFGARRTGSTRMHENLVELIDDRLRANHQIDRHADPAAASSILTPRLQQLVSSPRSRTTTVNELRRIVTDIESL